MAWADTIKGFETIVVTGGSSGIGAAFIRTIGTIGQPSLVCNISRSIPCELNVNPRLRHRPTDLGKSSEVSASARWAESLIEEAGDGPVLLINNAGFGAYGRFGEGEQANDLPMIDLNVRAVVGLTGELLPLLRRRGGAILNVSSLAAFQPVPYMATYAATKAFVLHWSLALREDLRGSGVHVLAVCPGPTESQFFHRAGFSQPPQATPGQTAEAVVEESLRALHRRRAMVVTGWRHRWAARGSACLPKVVVARLTRRLMERLRLSELTNPKS